jgi:hypothetical protein
MSLRELRMSDVREALRRWKAGQSARRWRASVSLIEIGGSYVMAAEELELGESA